VPKSCKESKTTHLPCVMHSRIASNGPRKMCSVLFMDQRFSYSESWNFRCHFFTDEAWFHLSRYVNSQNTRIWAAENHHTMHEEPLHSQKIRVWCGVSRRRIIGPIFFRTNSYHRSIPANIQQVCQSING